MGKDLESLIFLQTSRAEMNSLTEAGSFTTRYEQTRSKLPGAKVRTSYRGMQFFHEKLAESVPLGDN